MKASATALLSTFLAVLVAVTPVYAQPSGLRLQGNAEGLALRESDNGLRLRFSSQSLSAGIQSSSTSALTRNTLRADWPVFGYGLRTSLGLSWSAGETGNLSTSSNTEPATFLGLGWRGEPIRNSGWKLSAEMGASVSGSRGCTSIGPACPATHPQGLSGDAAGSGLRLNPYINFGATLNY